MQIKLNLDVEITDTNGGFNNSKLNLDLNKVSAIVAIKRLIEIINQIAYIEIEHPQ